MPRYNRLFLPDMPVHIVQRGHDRKTVFLRDADYEYYLENLQEARADLDIRVFGYCLMSNHVHLLIQPNDDPALVSSFMRILAGRQTRRFNRSEECSGTLWEGRFKASLVDSDQYLLACYRYIDLNPVRAGVVSAPEQYRWSSYRSHANAVQAEWLDRSDTFQSLGRSPQLQASAYRAFVAASDKPADDLIRTAVNRCQLTGSGRFRKRVEQRADRIISAVGPGRPPKLRDE